MKRQGVMFWLYFISVVSSKQASVLVTGCYNRFNSHVDVHASYRRKAAKPRLILDCSASQYTWYYWFENPRALCVSCRRWNQVRCAFVRTACETNPTQLRSFRGRDKQTAPVASSWPLNFRVLWRHVLMTADCADSRAVPRESAGSSMVIYLIATWEVRRSCSEIPICPTLVSM